MSTGSPSVDVPQPTTLSAGSRIGDLLLLREIGRGAQGVVFEGRQLSVGRTVAVKVMAKDHDLGAEQIERFRREAEAAGRLSHPHIVSVFGLEETEHHLMLMQEFVSGGNVGDLLAEGLGPGGEGVDGEEACRQAAALCRRLAEAMQHAHDHGVIHRDLKPDNILLTEDGEPKITDFGLARVEDKLGLSQTGAIMGTPHYMSPEQVTADPAAIDARTDVYSLGSLLYRFLTGCVPIDGKSLQGIFHNILTRPPRLVRQLNPAVTRDLEAVCLKALEKDPGDRYATAGELAADLGRYLDGGTTVARPEGTLLRTFRVLRRQTSPTLALTAVLIPVLWVALDALVLAPLAGSRDDLHVGRLALLTGLATVLAWPLRLLARRVVRRRRWAEALAVGLAVLLWAAAGWRIREQWSDGLQAEHREQLVARLDQEPVGARSDVSDLEAYVARWEQRFEARDVLAVARGYLKRERPVQAARWIEGLDTASVGTPVQDALLLAVHDTLGHEELAREAEARLERPAGVATWQAWRLAGDVLRDNGRSDAALDAYLRAGRFAEASRDALNIQLARVSADLCAWDDAAEYLHDYQKWFPEDPACQHLLYRTAAGQRRWDDAQQALERYARDDSVMEATGIRLQHSLWRLQSREAECWELVQRAVDSHADDQALLEWCGQQALEEQQRELAVARAAAATRDDAGAVAARDRSSAALDVAAEVYRRLGLLDSGRVSSELGLAAVAMQRADLTPEQQIPWLERALDHATTARAADDASWQAHYNVGHATLRLASARAGGFDGIPLEVLRDYVAAMREALDRNGQQPRTLNNTAWVQGKFVHALSGDRADLEAALELAHRAVRLTDPGRGGGGCQASLTDLHAHSSAHDTLRGLQELAGELAAALVSARSARDALPAGDPAIPRRSAEVRRLEQAARAGD